MSVLFPRSVPPLELHENGEGEDAAMVESRDGGPMALWRRQVLD